MFVTHAHNFLLQSYDVPIWGREAVAVFFVLSGFVISYVGGSKEADWRAYATARLARVLPVCVLALIITALLDTVGVKFDPGHYAALQRQFQFYVPVSWGAVAADLSFTNQLWHTHVIYGTDEPYWSLGFEVQYYLVFGFLLFVRPLWAKTLLILIWCVFVGPKILMYLPLWLMGVAALKLVTSGRFPRGIGPAIAFNAVAIGVAYAADVYLGARAISMYLSYGLVTELFNFGYFNAIGLAVALHLLGMAALVGLLPAVPERIGHGIRWLAGASFTIYLIHQPLLVFLSMFQGSPGNAVGGAALAIVAILCCLGLAELAERRKKMFAGLFGAVLRMTGDPMRTRPARLPIAPRPTP